MTWPEEVGGRGLTHVDAALVEDVFGYHWLPLSLYLLSYKTIGCALERFATPALKEQLLGPIARGELTFCQGFSEPEAGSDLAALTTRAVRQGDRFVVDGRKIWTSSAWLADWIYLAVRTNPDEPRHRGISVLVAPIDTPGIEVRRFSVLGGGYLCEVFLDGVEIPAENLVGEVDRGWDVLMHTLDFERITAEKLGGLAWILDGLEARLAETDRLDEARAARVASLRGELAGARLLSLRAADLLDRGEPASAASAMAKLAGARLAQRLAREGVELLGLEGLADGHPSAAARRTDRRAVSRVRRLDHLGRLGGDPADRHRPARAGASVKLPARGRARRRVRAVRRRAALRRAPRRSRRRRREGRAAGRRRVPACAARHARPRPLLHPAEPREALGRRRPQDGGRARDERMPAARRGHRSAQLPARARCALSARVGRPPRRTPRPRRRARELVRYVWPSRRRTRLRPRRPGARRTAHGARVSWRHGSGACRRNTDGRPHGRVPARVRCPRRARSRARHRRGRARRRVAARGCAGGSAPGSRLARRRGRRRRTEVSPIARTSTLARPRSPVVSP